MSRGSVLITGAAGFLGSHLVDAYLRRGFLVIGVDNFFRGKPENLPKECKDFIFVKLDLTSEDATELLSKYLREYSVNLVIHYAAINGTKYFYDIPYKVLDDNVRMTQNVLRATELAGCVRKVVYASSSEVYGEPSVIPTPESHPIMLEVQQRRDSYAASKALGEFYVKLFSETHGIDYLILRIFNTYGPRMDTSEYGQVIPELIRKLFFDEVFTIIGPGTQTRSFCYVDDHVRLVMKLVEKCRNDVFNVGSDEEVTILELAKILHELVGRPFKPKILPPRPGDRMRRRPDISKLIRAVDDKPRIGLREGLKLTINYYIKLWGICDKVSIKED